MLIKIEENKLIYIYEVKSGNDVFLIKFFTKFLYVKISSYQLNDSSLNLFGPGLDNFFVHNILELIQFMNHLDQYLISATILILCLTTQ